MFPTKRFVFLLLIGGALLGLGSAWPAALLAGLFFDGLLLMAFLGDVLLSASPEHIRVTRRLPDPISVGAPCPVTIEVRNRGGHATTVRIRDSFPPTLEAETDTVEVHLPPRGHDRLKLRVTPRRRGEQQVGDLAVRYTTRLGLAWRQFRSEATTTVRVYPDVANVNAYELLLRSNRLGEVGLTPARRLGEGTQFESLREYQHGDELRCIDWKATAKYGKPISKNYQVEQSQNLLLMIDTGRLMTSEFQGMSRLDYVLNASLMLAYVALNRGDAVGVLAFSDQVETFLPLRSGKAVSRSVLTALHSLEPTLAESDYAGAFRFLAGRSRKRALILLFTDVLDERASESVLSHMTNMARHHRPLCVTLRNPQIEEIADSAPASQHEAYAKVVAMNMVREREKALHHMRRRGVDTLDVPPDRLTVRAVSKYVEIKQRLRL